MKSRKQILALTLLILVQAVVIAESVHFARAQTAQRTMAVICFEFPDFSHQHSLDTIRTRLNELDTYYREVSYGKVGFNGDIYGWYMISTPLGNLKVVTLPLNWQDRLKLIDEALSVARARMMKTETYDYVNLVFAGNVWPFSNAHQVPSSDPLSRIAVNNENSDFAHETGHLLGLKDLYDTAKATKAEFSGEWVDTWDLMSLGNNGLSAWSRMKLGWINQEQIASVSIGQSANITLAPLELGEGTLAVKISDPSISTWYYVVENRRRIGVDKNLPGEGVLVYLAYDSTPSGQGPLRLVNITAYDLRYNPERDSLNAGFIDDKNNVAVVLTQAVGLSFKLSITTASRGRILIQQIRDSVRMPATNAFKAMKPAEAAVYRAWSEGRSVDDASQLLLKARNAYSTGDYESATSLANQAKTVAEASKETRNRLAIATDYSFYSGSLDSNYAPVARVNGYLKSASPAQCYMRVKYLADMPAVVYTSRFYGPDGSLVDERNVNGNPRKAGDSSVWTFQTNKIGQSGAGVWKLETYLGTHLVFMEYFSIGDFLFNVSSIGLPSGFNTTIYVDGQVAGIIRSGEIKASALANGPHTISVNEAVEASSSQRYVCGSCSLSVSSGGSHTFEYSEQTTKQTISETAAGLESITRTRPTTPTRGGTSYLILGTLVVAVFVVCAVLLLVRKRKIERSSDT